MTTATTSVRDVLAPARPRVGFAGVGWIGRNRMAAMARLGTIDLAVIADPDGASSEEAGLIAPDAERITTIEDLLETDLDAVVIATPSALHASQSIRALEAGMAVFCQKPLGRTADETRAVVDAARSANRLLGVDLSYRHTAAMQAIRDLVQGGEIGDVFAVDLVFHNAYGPGRDWFYDRRLSGGGCLIDLGIHLIDQALWTLGFPTVTSVTGRLLRGGVPLPAAGHDVEDYAAARLDLENGTCVNLTCSWNLPAGCDAVIGATFYGTQGGLSMRNVDGSYYDFVLERFEGRSRELLVKPPDDWGGRAAASWAEQLVRDPVYDPEIEQVITVSEILDRLYAEST